MKNLTVKAHYLKKKRLYKTLSCIFISSISVQPAYAEESTISQSPLPDTANKRQGKELNVERDKQNKEWQQLLNKLKQLDKSQTSDVQENTLNNSIKRLTSKSEQKISSTSKLDGSSKVLGLDDFILNKAIDSISTYEHLGLIHKPNNEASQTDITSQKSSLLTNQSTKQALPFDPTIYLPEYQPSKNSAKKPITKKKSDKLDEPSLIQKLKINLFHDGLPPLPKVEVKIYYQPEPNTARVKVDSSKQPYKNIKTALEEIYLDTIIDFTSALPIIQRTAKEAAEVVGYYDVQMIFLQPKYNGNKGINVIIESVGEPVKVENRLIDVRGEGGDMVEFQAMEDTLPPLKGKTFDQGAYKSSKSVINATTSQMGFFDSKWLNSSADVILPDNTADIDLIYDTGARYKFGEVVFFTFDEKSQKLTTDPDKLPVKRELLQQLVTFREGDDYYNPKINQLRNNLTATGYFNRAYVEEVSPNTGNGGDSISFESLANNGSETIVDTKIAPVSSPVDIALVAFPHFPIGEKTGLSIEDLDITNITNIAKNNNRFDGTANSIINNLINSAIEDAISKNSANSNGDYEQTAQKQLASITFSIDTSANEKFQAIANKAKNLLMLPDDRVLNEQAKESKSTLGKLTNEISSVAKAILPDETQTTPFIGKKYSKLVGKQTPQQVEKSKKVPLYVFVATNKPYDAKLGFGYGKGEGFRMTAKLDNNLMNKKGDQAGISAEWSNAEKKIGIHTSRPWKHPLNDKLRSNLSYEEKTINQGNNNNWTTKTMQAGVARNRYSVKGWNRNYSLRYRNDKLDLGTDISANSADLPVRFNASDPTQQALLLGYSMHKTKTNNPTNPNFGYRQHYSLEAGLNDVGTDTNMVIARAGVSGVYSFGESEKHQMVGKLNAGYLWAEDFADVPYTLRFFAGGDQSIRGYDYNSLSPIENGYLTGGQILGFGSAEYNYEFKEGLRGAVFTDIGNAYDKDLQTPTKVAAGFGLRWASPVGRVRIDVGAGLNEDDSSIPVNLHLFIGSPL